MRWVSRSVWLILAFLCMAQAAWAQRTGSVRGRVNDAYGRRIARVNITVEDQDFATKTDSLGEYRLEMPVGKYYLVFAREEFDTTVKYVEIKPNVAVRKDAKLLDKSFHLGTQYITDDRDPNEIPDPGDGFTTLIPIEPKKVTEMPGLKTDLSGKLQTMYSGVTSNNEFSSQYRVRGGNFDENLVYVNDILIYRPFLIRSGQQEGLGFVNPNLASEVGFSSGGFQARYGDKLSSVLDVTYTQPRDFRASAELGILNQNLHFEGSVKKKEQDEDRGDYIPGSLTYLFGGRRFTPSYVLRSLDTKGAYRPVFHDAQLMMTFTPGHADRAMKVREKKDGQDTLYLARNPLKLTTFFHFANNNYNFVPEGRETSFGTVQQAFKLRVAFEGQEITSYTTNFGALMLEHRPSVRLRIKYILSAFNTVEAELFDVEGGYFLSEVNTNFGSEGYGEEVFDIGIGTFFRHGRNYLTATVVSGEQRGDWFPGKDYRHKVSWGLRAQYQDINDDLTEWSGLDSAGYFELEESIRTQLNVRSTLYKAYLQDHWKLDKRNSLHLIAGTRVMYNDLNEQMLFSPRVQLIIDPARKKPEDGSEAMDESLYARSDRRNWQLRFSAGVYHQPLFYREMRAIDGTLNTQRKAQTSIHFIAGGDYLFKIWDRPFKFFGEAYFKRLYNLVPYEVDNVRIRYYPYHTADGFAYGVDTRISGEFIKGVDSWLSLGLLRTTENIAELPEQGYVPRPSDQRLSLGIYFQDELPIDPTYKVHINMVYGSGMRYGPPRTVEARTIFGMPSYQRVDLGFSKMLVFHTDEEREGKFGFRSLWITAEIFNLFQRANTVSYTWIKDVYNQQYAVPNFLSNRLLNLRLIGRF